MSLVKFMDRVERGLREYFKGNAAIAVFREQVEGGDVVRFAKLEEIEAPWAELKIWCGHGPGSGKVVVRAMAPRPKNVSHYNWPKLNSCTFSLETSVSDKTIANRVMREIIEPAREPMARYLEIIAHQEAEEAALPAVIAKFRAMGINVRTPQSANATEADFYISQTAMDNSPQISISGRVHANGRVTLERCYLDAERGEALMKLISEIK